MELHEENIIELELKYCERCGGLWLRIRGTDGVYCAACMPAVAELPAPTRHRVRPRLPINDRTGLNPVPALQDLGGKGGNA
jgi:Zn-finger nucleic acid-binding protein